MMEIFFKRRNVITIIIIINVMSEQNEVFICNNGLLIVFSLTDPLGLYSEATDSQWVTLIPIGINDLQLVDLNKSGVNEYESRSN